mgnify:CR=1 FL=1
MIISYIGKERCDIIYHLIKIGINAGKRLLVIDNSMTHDLFSLFEKNDGEDIQEHGNLTICKDYKLGKKAQEYDCVYLYEGIVPRYEGKRDVQIIAPGCENTEIKQIRAYLDELVNNGTEFPEETYVIERDKVNRKITAKTLSSLLNVNTQNCIDLEFDVKDYSQYVSLTHNMRTSSAVSAQMYEVIESIAVVVYNTNAKMLKKLMR